MDTSSPTIEAGPAAARVKASAGYRWYVMSLLTAIYVANFIDRQVVNILAEPIKNELKLSDGQLGWLTGLAFAVLYTLLGIPTARLAERGDRPLLISIAALAWSACTAACGLARNFVQLIAARIGVGVGEAGCTPPAHSLIMDYTPPARRGSALAFYGMGAPVGGMIGMTLGGFATDAYGWRTAFFWVGAPGVILALLTFLTLKEPRKAQANLAAPATDHGQQLKFLETLGLLAAKRAYRYAVLGISLTAYVAIGSGVFTASFLLRNHGPALTQLAHGLGLGPMSFLGLTLGVVSGVFGAIGMAVGGQLCDRFAQADVRLQLRIPAIAAACYVPIFVGALLVDQVGVTLALLAASAFLGGVYYGPVTAVSLSVVPPNARATASAISLFSANLIGLGLGPLSVGYLSDAFASHVGKAEGIRFALICASLAAWVAALLYWRGSNTLPADLRD